MKKSKKVNGKSIITGALLLGGVLGGIAGISAIAHATETKVAGPQNRQAKNLSDDLKEIVVPFTGISSEDELIKLVFEKGTQILIDDATGQLYVVYLEGDQVLVAEVTEEYLLELLRTPMPISEEKDNNSQTSEGIPQEYWRGENATTTNRSENTNKQRKRLNSEEGRKAIDEAKKYKRENKK